MKEQSPGLLERVCPFSSISAADSATATTETSYQLIPLENGFSVRINEHISDLPIDALRNLTPEDAVLSDHMLTFLEEHPPAGFQFYYLTFYNEQQLMGFAPFQLFEFRGDRNVQAEGTPEKINWWLGLRARVLDWIVQKVHIRVLVNGNMLFTGDHTYRFDPVMKTEEIFALLEQGIELLVEHLKREGKSPHIYGIKDIPNDRMAKAEKLLSPSFSKSTFSPDMVLPLQSDWNTFGDYLDALTSKYRVRVKRARKKSKGAVRLEMDIGQIRQYQDQLFSLFQNVVGTSSFNVVHFERDFFLGMKQTFPDRYRLFGYFKDDQLIGFFTTLKDGDILEAHYLGYDESVNRDLQLYLNMLYDMIEIGLEEGVKAVNYARTSLEIKSSVGAKAAQMWCYYKHRNKWINRILPFLIQRYSQEDPWTPRHPFKSNQ